MAAPVKHTCPDIDKVIIEVRSALKTARKGQKHFDKHHEAQDYFWDIEYALDGVENILEQLRKDNTALREWGQELEKQIEQ